MSKARSKSQAIPAALAMMAATTGGDFAPRSAYSPNRRRRYTRVELFGKKKGGRRTWDALNGNRLKKSHYDK